MKKSIIVASLFLLAACSAKMITPSQGDADRVSVRVPGTTLADLNEGKSLFESKCTQCHSLNRPSSKTEAEWREIVPDMAQRAAKAHKQLIDEHAQAQILKYLTAYCKLS